MRKKGFLRLSRESRNNIGKKICKEFTNEELEVNAVSAEHLRG